MQDQATQNWQAQGSTIHYFMSTYVFLNVVVRLDTIQVSIFPLVDMFPTQ